MGLEEVVEISDPCWGNIKSNLIEKRRNEAIGDLIGTKVGKRYIIVSAYPWTTGETTTSWAAYGNETARRRVIDMNRAEREHSDVEIIGQYHTHVYAEKEDRAYLGIGEEQDSGLLRTVMKDYGLDESVQIVATVKIKENSKRKPGEKSTPYEKKLRITFGDEKTRYDVILAAYILTQESWKEVKIIREGE